MQIKKFKVKNIKEAMERIKEEMGEDAFILSDKQISEKGEKWIEIIAAVERDSASPPFRTSPAIVKIKDEENKKINELANIVKMVEEFRSQEVNIEPLKEEIKIIKELIKKSFIKQDNIDFDGKFYEIYRHLLNEGVNESLANKIVKIMDYQIPIKHQDNYEYLKSYLWKTIYSALPDVKVIDGKSKHIIAFIGPTGVGKTTTIAKLSANYSLGEQKKVALISVDNYRIGAQEQLKTYASLIGIPFALANDKDELEKYLKMFSEYDLIFIDTTGKKPAKDSLKKDGEFLNIKGIEKILVLSATTKSMDLLKIMELYKILNPSSVIFTKMDETFNYGNVFNTIVSSKIGLSFWTMGQKVPEDIEIASSQKLTNLLLRSIKNGSS
jgi:flagellar biosynthesis protein FlhF